MKTTIEEKDDDLKSSHSLDHVFSNVTESIRLLLMGDINGSISYLEDREDSHSFYKIFKVGLEVTALTDLDQGNVLHMNESIDSAIYQLESMRHKKSWLSTQDYEKYSDEDALVEVFIATGYCMKAMNLIIDGSYICYIKASLLMRKSYVIFTECRKLLSMKKVWLSKRSKDEFESFMRIGCGLFECGISFIHPQFMWVLQLLGYTGNRRYALDQIRIAAQLPTSIQGFSVILLLLSHLLIRPMLDPLIEADESLIETSLTFLKEYLKDGIFGDLTRVIVESRTGDIKRVKPFLVKATQQKYPMAHLNKYMHLLNLMSAICEENWNDAIGAISILEESKYTPAFACYIRGCILMHKLNLITDKVEREQLRHEITNVFKSVPKKKRSHGGSKTFHKQYILKNAQRFAQSPDKQVFPLYEMLGLFNFLKIVPLLPEYTNGALKQINRALDNASNRITDDELISLLYSKATLLASEDDAAVISLLTQVTESNCTYNSHLQAQANYELGVIKYKFGEIEEARNYFKRARSLKGHSLTELIDYRVALCLDSMDRSNCKLRRRGSLDDVLPAIFA